MNSLIMRPFHTQDASGEGDIGDEPIIGLTSAGPLQDHDAGHA